MARGDAPEDGYHLVGTSFFILGLGTLLPWNFFITAIPYFQARLAVVNVTGEPSDTNVTSPGDAFNFNNWMTLLSQLPLLLFTLLNSFLYQCIPEMVRILGSLLGILMLFILTAALVKVDMSPELFFSITMASIWFINSFCAILQGSLFGQLGAMPPTYSTLFLSGQGLAGTFAALAMLMSMASGVDAQTSALGYFITPCVGILVSIACYLSLSHLEFARYYLDKKAPPPQAYELETRAELLQADEKNGFAGSPQKARLALELELEPEKEPKPGKASVLLVLRKIWVMALCIVLVFTVTLSVFPAITAMVTSSRGPGKWSQFFNPICCFLLFNTMDWLGRSMTSYFLWCLCPREGLAGGVWAGTMAVTKGALCYSWPPAGPGWPPVAAAGLPAFPVCSPLHAVPRARAVPPAGPLPAGRLLHHFHAAFCTLQWLPGVSHHVPGAQAGPAP
uniref:Solute carrier family 29 member 2 n=1 Tax=Vombatus ursinus TaxID=29139 RepID=A0A4X2JPG0_VOMUR